VEEHRKRIFYKFIEDIQEAFAGMRKNQGVVYQSELSAEVMAISILGMFERIAYHYLIWQNRPGELQTVSRDAIDFIVGGINVLSKSGESYEER